MLAKICSNAESGGIIVVEMEQQEMSESWAAFVQLASPVIQPQVGKLKPSEDCKFNFRRQYDFILLDHKITRTLGVLYAR
jgi:hypothetical protein